MVTHIDIVRATLDYLDDPQVRARRQFRTTPSTEIHRDHLIELGRKVLECPRAFTMKQWMMEHDRTTVDTLQLKSADTIEPWLSAWAPLSRIVNAHERAGAVVFHRPDDPEGYESGSLRDYAGMKVIAYHPDALIVADEWHTILYVAAAGLDA